MKAIIVGDLHIDNRKSSIKNSESFDEIFRLFRQLTNKVLEERPDFVIFVGDIFDSPESISTNVLSVVTMLFNDLSSLVKVIIIAGNHDVVDDNIQSIDLTGGSKGHLRSSLVYYFKLNEEIYVVDKPQINHFDEIKTSILFIPYNNDIVESLNSISKDIRQSYTNILIGHFETKDVNYIKMIPDQSLVEHIPSAKELFDKYHQNLVLLGHIHDMSIIEEGNNRLVYVGSARNINYNNRDEVKGMHILDLNTLSLEFVPNTDTAIYKVFRDPNDLDKYLETNDPETLAKTKIKFVYTDSADTLKYVKAKKNLRRLEFEKAVFSNSNGSDIRAIDLDGLKIENLTSKEKIFDFILDFKEVTGDKRKDYLHFIETLDSEDDEEEFE